MSVERARDDPYGGLREKIAAYELFPFMSLVRLTQLLASDADIPWDRIRAQQGAAVRTPQWEFAVIRSVVMERKCGMGVPRTGAGILTPSASVVHAGPSAFRPWRSGRDS